MANEEHISWLLEGAEVWNEWFWRERRRYKRSVRHCAGIAIVVKGRDEDEMAVKGSERSYMD